MRRHADPPPARQYVDAYEVRQLKEMLAARRELKFRRTQMGRWEDDGGK